MASEGKGTLRLCPLRTLCRESPALHRLHRLLVVTSAPSQAPRPRPRPAAADIEDLARVDAVWNLFVLLARGHRPLPRALVDERVSVLQEAAPCPAAAHHRGTAAGHGRRALPLLPPHFRGTGRGRGRATGSRKGHASLPALGFAGSGGLSVLCV